MKLACRLLLLFAILSIQVIAQADDAALTQPEKVGLSSERLERITNQIQADVDSGKIPGAVAIVARKGEIVYARAFGKANMEKNTEMSVDKMFRIYSMTKPIVSAALMMLHEENKFKLNDPIEKYMPEFANMHVLVERGSGNGGPVFNLPETDEEGNPVYRGIQIDPSSYYTVPAERSITVQDLLRHTAGFTYGFFGNTTVDKMYQRDGILTRDKDLADFTARLAKIPLQYQPGTTWHYSVSVDVQGRLIEVLSGMPLDKFLDERIFKPLGMNDTAFYASKEKLDRLAQLYAPKNGGGIEPANPMISRNFVNAPAMFSGGGGLVSTAQDYMRFCQMMLNGGELDGKRLLSRKTIELMTMDHCGDIENYRPMSNGYGFGLGFAVAQDLAQAGQAGSEGEFNWGGAAGTRFWIDPKEELIGIYMVQILPHPYSFGEEFKQLTYQAIAD